MSVAFSLSVLICFSFFCIVVDDVFSITDKLVILQYSPSCRNVSLQFQSDLINILNIISFRLFPCHFLSSYCMLNMHIQILYTHRYFSFSFSVRNLTVVGYKIL